MHAATSLSLIPPGTGGVRDYAALLGEPLDAPVRELSEHTDTRDWSGHMLLLHFSGYGFHKRGVPAWLLDELQTLRARFRVFGVVFHELYATGNPPWTSAFWLSNAQRRIARELVSQADFWLTNRELSGQWLRDQAPRAPHRVLPVFSNVGEPRVAEHERDASIVVFGSASVRASSYAWNDGEIFRFAKRHGLRIYDIGSALQDAGLAQKLVDEGVVVRGMLPADQVSQALLSARHGVLSYPADFVAKSGIFAAYAAHGMCPVLLWRDYDVHDGLRAGVNYAAGFGALDALGTGDFLAQAARIGRAARQWYEPHRVDAHVDALKTMSTEARP